ncbi:MAG: hypothetical protein RL398_1346 [Planctomycetota bacterium]
MLTSDANTSRTTPPAAIALVELRRGPYTLTADAICAQAGVDPAVGLAGVEVDGRLRQFGGNDLSKPPTTPAWRRFLRHWREPVVLLLLGAAAISGALGKAVDAAVIVGIVAANAALAFLQEGRAERALAALRTLAKPSARVLREGILADIDAGLLVPGDVVHMSAGDLVPADVRLVTTTSFRTQEAALTGESTPVAKDARAVLAPTTPLAERSNSAYLGTLAVHGNATAVVVATGMATELGAIAGLLQVEKQRLTPMQERLRVLGRNLALLCIAIAAALATWHLWKGESVGDVLLRSIGLAVAAVPEGLPAVVAIALAMGMHRLVRANALMLRMSSVETLGSVDVVCTDKTGTLTRNVMEVCEVHGTTTVYTADRTGPSRTIHWRAEPPNASQSTLIRALDIGRLCNTARLRPTGDLESPWTVLGDPTEGALLVAAHDAGLAIEPAAAERIVFEIPFDSERRRMSVAVQHPEAMRVYAKGATEALVECCTRVLLDDGEVQLDAEHKLRILSDADRLGSRGLRVLALAYRDGPATPQDAERDLVFAALVAMRDPPRPEVPEAVALCRAAGIRPVMITGDHPGTALAIAREIGLADADVAVVTGTDLDQWSDQRLDESIDGVAVFARTTAVHKLRLVRALRARGHVVAMTGDGVNDAPALREADIGIAMGRCGTAVTRQAADLVLLDDNFATIVAAVREGRGIFDNIQRFVHYLLATNASEVLFVVLAAACAWPPPLTALNLLWINLVTDGLPALALGMEPTAPGVLAQAPRRRTASVVDRTDALGIAALGILAAAIAALAFAWGLHTETATARTMALNSLVVSQLLLAFAFRSRTQTALRLGLSTNPHLLVCATLAAALQATVVLVPALRTLLGLTSLSLGQWALTVGGGLIPVTLVETWKVLRTSATKRIRRGHREVGRCATAHRGS